MAQRRKLILIVAGLLALCVAVVLVILGAASLATRPAAAAGDAFMAALARQDFEAADALFTDSLRAEVGAGRAFGDMIVTAGLTPRRWRFTSRSVNGDTGELSGSVTFADGREGILYLRPERVGDRWLIGAFSIQPTSR